MQYTTIKGDSTVRALAGRIFGVGPRTAVAGRAADALLAANPALANIKDLADGTPILVPALADATPVEALEDLGDLAATAALDSSQPVLAALGFLLDAVVVDRRAEADERRSAIADARRQVRGAPGEPLLIAALDRATAAAEETKAEVGALEAVQQPALDAIAAQIKEFEELFKPR